MDKEQHNSLEENVMARAQQIFTEYTAQHDSLTDALMAATVKLAKLEFAENARLKREGKL